MTDRMTLAGVRVHVTIWTAEIHGRRQFEHPSLLCVGLCDD